MGRASRSAAAQTLTLPDVNSYANTNGGTTYLQANGAGSTLKLPALTSLGGLERQSRRPGASRRPDALARAGLPGHQQPRTSRSRVDGSGSEIDLTTLTSLDVANSGSLAVTNHATLLDPNLTSISRIAVTFDGNPPIATDQVNDEDPSQGIDRTKEALITIDNTRPTSSVNPLPATETTTSFTVSWSGSDGDGSGIAYYNVYVSDNGGTYNNFMMDTTATSTTYTGQAGHTYRFISIATSNVGLNQPGTSTPQATTTVTAPNGNAIPDAVPHIHVAKPHSDIHIAWPDVFDTAPGNRDERPRRDQQEAPGDRGHRHLQRRRQRHRGG